MASEDCPDIRRQRDAYMLHSIPDSQGDSDFEVLLMQSEKDRNNQHRRDVRLIPDSQEDSDFAESVLQSEEDQRQDMSLLHTIPDSQENSELQESSKQSHDNHNISIQDDITISNTRRRRNIAVPHTAVPCTGPESQESLDLGKSTKQSKDDGNKRSRYSWPTSISRRRWNASEPYTVPDNQEDSDLETSSAQSEDSYNTKDQRGLLVSRVTPDKPGSTSKKLLDNSPRSSAHPRKKIKQHVLDPEHGHNGKQNDVAHRPMSKERRENPTSSPILNPAQNISGEFSQTQLDNVEFIDRRFQLDTNDREQKLALRWLIDQLTKCPVMRQLKRAFFGCLELLEQQTQGFDSNRIRQDLEIDDVLSLLPGQILTEGIVLSIVESYRRAAPFGSWWLIPSRYFSAWIENPGGKALDDLRRLFKAELVNGTNNATTVLKPKNLRQRRYRLRNSVGNEPTTIILPIFLQKWILAIVWLGHDSCTTFTYEPGQPRQTESVLKPVLQDLYENLFDLDAVAVRIVPLRAGLVGQTDDIGNEIPSDIAAEQLEASTADTGILVLELVKALFEARGRSVRAIREVLGCQPLIENSKSPAFGFGARTSIDVDALRQEFSEKLTEECGFGEPMNVINLAAKLKNVNLEPVLNIIKMRHSAQTAVVESNAGKARGKTASELNAQDKRPAEKDGKMRVSCLSSQAARRHATGDEVGDDALDRSSSTLSDPEEEETRWVRMVESMAA